MLIGGLQKSSLLDYPEKIAAILFTQGCNFRCGYCHNPELLQTSVQNPSQITVADFLDFLKTRIGKLDGVVITGGEPCLQHDLKSLIKEIKELGFLVKLDTNGSYPDILKDLIQNNLIDYVAMDIKAPLSKYHKITATIIQEEKIKESINFLLKGLIPYEFRTTVISSQLTFEDFEKIADLINGAEKYYLQKFISSKIYNAALMKEKTYSTEEFNKIITMLKTKIKKVELR